MQEELLPGSPATHFVNRLWNLVMPSRVNCDSSVHMMYSINVWSSKYRPINQLQNSSCWGRSCGSNWWTDVWYGCKFYACKTRKTCLLDTLNCTASSLMLIDGCAVTKLIICSSNSAVPAGNAYDCMFFQYLSIFGKTLKKMCFCEKKKIKIFWIWKALSPQRKCRS